MDEYWERNIITPLNLDNGLFKQVNEKQLLRCGAATGMRRRSKKGFAERFTTTNCRALEGVVGHAVLFISATKSLKPILKIGAGKAIGPHWLCW